MKDARWNLARKMLDAIGFELDETTYEILQSILNSAQMILDEYGWMINPEADEWNNNHE